MLRLAFVALGAVALLGFPISGSLQSSAESRYTKVQWVRNGRPVGEVERALVGDAPRLAGTGPEGSVFIDRRYRDRSRPFGVDAGIYALARLGCLAALLTSIFGFFLHRKLERAVKIERGDVPL